MTDKIRVLLAGESWISTSSHYKGFNHFSSAFYETGEIYLKNALKAFPDIQYQHMPAHEVPTDFPLTIEQMQEFDVLIISDIGSDSFLLHPDVFLKGETRPNRLNLIKKWVEAGGGLIMCGGYLSFSGFGAAAKYYRTAIEDVLPVNIFPFDDRIETPEGAKPEIIDKKHSILTGISDNFPILLGYQDVQLKKDAALIVGVNGDSPLLATWDYSQGRSAAWATDVGPHWCPSNFVKWDSFGKLWHQIIQWAAHKI